MKALFRRRFMNQVIVAGRLGADAEVRYTQDGQKIVSLRLASNFYRNGKEETIWWSVSFFGDRLDKMLPYLTKGSALFVTGEFMPRPYNDKEGRERISFDIRADRVSFSPFGGGRQGENGQGQQGQQGYQQQNHQQQNYQQHSPSGFGAEQGAQNGAFPSDSFAENEEIGAPPF